MILLIHNWFFLTFQQPAGPDAGRSLEGAAVARKLRGAVPGGAAGAPGAAAPRDSVSSRYTADPTKVLDPSPVLPPVPPNPPMDGGKDDGACCHGSDHVGCVVLVRILWLKFFCG